MLHKQLRALIDDALNAPAFHAHTPTGMHEPTAYIPVPATRGMVACLKTENLPSCFGKDGKLRRTPNGAPAANTVRMDAGVIAGSRIADAGAHVIVCAEQTKAIPAGPTGGIAFEHKPGFLRTVEAAKFSAVADGADVPVSQHPVSSEKIDWSQAISRGFRIELPRATRYDTPTDDVLCEEIATALVLGLARAADSVLLESMTGAALPNFSLAGAAAQGLKFGELYALIGTSGTGATVSQDGRLRVAGVPAELTGDAAGTFLGAWDRAGVAIHESVDVHFERTSKRGDIVVTAWANLIALLPDPSKFWSVV